MQVGDWVIAALNAAIGALLGAAADGLVQLGTTAFWPVAVLLSLLLVGMILFVVLFDAISDRIFSIGVRGAEKPLADARTPLPRLLSLPAGVVLGVVLARLGIADTLAGLIP